MLAFASRITESLWHTGRDKVPPVLDLGEKKITHTYWQPDYISYNKTKSITVFFKTFLQDAKFQNYPAPAMWHNNIIILALPLLVFKNMFWNI